MSQTPSHIEVLDPIDRWLHLGAIAGLLGSLATGPILEWPASWPPWMASAAWITLVHGLSATLIVLALAFHLVRVCLAWLEGENPSSLLALLARPADVREFLSSLSGQLSRQQTVRLWGRFSFRERFPYTFFILAFPLLAATGWAVGHPSRAAGIIGADGVLLLARAHSIMGGLSVPILLWHVYFTSSRPEALYWNSAWLTGRVRWERVESMWPGWAREIREELAPSTAPEEETPSVEELLERGNAAAHRGDYTMAQEAFAEALRLYPGYSQAWFNLAVVRYRAGDAAGATEAIESFLSRDPFGPMSQKARELLARIQRDGRHA